LLFFVLVCPTKDESPALLKDFQWSQPMYFFSIMSIWFLCFLMSVAND
jgi:hypothetical protein